ncbi:MAG: glycosyltransferase [Thermoleophilia bacterium]
MTTAVGAARTAAALARAYCRLLVALRRRVAVDAIVVGYPGHFVVPLGQLAALGGAKLVFDPLVSLHDTFVGDRSLISGASVSARMVGAVDRLACLLPDLVLADTRAHAEYYRDTIGVPESRLAVVPVGALPVAGASGAARTLVADKPLRVLQYGKWSPLHGTETVLAAAELLRDAPIHFVLVGEGQLSVALRRTIADCRLTNVEWLGSLTAERLRSEVLRADVCLGIFGRSQKAARVVPNKVYDALACGRPLVTANTEGAREFLSDGVDSVLVPAADAPALASALRGLLSCERRDALGRGALELYRRSLTPHAVAERMLEAMNAL